MMKPCPVILYLVTEDWYFSLHRLPLARAAIANGYRVILLARFRGHGRVLENAGIECIDIGWDRRSFKIHHAVRDLAKIIRYYKSIRPDIVHHVAIKPCIFGSLAAFLTRTEPVVNNLAGLGGSFTMQGMRAGLVRYLLRKAFGFFFNLPGTTTLVENADDRDFLVRDIGVGDSAVVLIRGVGVNTSRFEVCAEPSGIPVVTMVSRLLWHKGVGELVEAARILKTRECQVRIQLVGEPDPDNRDSVPLSRLQQWDSEGIVSWLGFREDINGIWAASNAGVLPTFYREGVPRSLLEAAACGRAIIASDMPGCRELVQSGENGLLVPPRDANALADAIEQVVADPAARRRMGEKGRQLVEQEFSEDYVMAKTLELYENVIQASRTVSG